MAKSIRRIMMMALAILIGGGSMQATFGSQAVASDQQPSQAATLASSFFAAETTVLDNGMEVVVIPDHRTPVVTHMVWYKVGGADDPKGSAGLAHFLEHLMFKGTKNHTGEEFQKAVSGVGGRENAFTSQDYTAYFQTVAKPHLATMMHFEADRMRHLTLKEEDVNPERDVVLEERASRMDNDPTAQLSEKLQASLYPNHPYGISIIGPEEDIKGLNREKALAFYNRFYTPESAILVLAGDVTLQEIKPLLDKTYGRIERNPQAQTTRSRPAETATQQRPRVVVEDGRVRTPVLMRRYIAPSYARSSDEETTAYDIAIEALMVGRTSTLYQRLVVQEKVAATFSAGYDGAGLDHGTLYLSMTPQEGVTLEALEQALDKALLEESAKPLEAADIERVKAKLITQAIYARDSVASLARLVGSARTMGIPISSLQNNALVIRSITPQQAQTTLQRWLNINNSATGYLLPAKDKAS